MPDLIDRLSRVFERSDPGGLQAIVTAWAAAANRRSGAEPEARSPLRSSRSSVAGTAPATMSRSRRVAHPQESRAHTRRHSSLLNDLRVRVKIAKEQLGHASVTTTLNVYTHVVDASHRQAIESVEERLLVDLDSNGLESEKVAHPIETRSASHA